MAEASSQEKSEEATPKRLREARKKGQVAKSRDLNTIVILIVAFGAIAFMIPYLHSKLKEILFASFPFFSMQEISNEHLLQYLSKSFHAFAWILLPYVIAVAGVALAVGFLQVGPVFSVEPILLQWKRLNIIENAKNMFKTTTFVELIKNIVKIVLVFYIAYWVIKKNLPQILMTVNADLVQTTIITGEVLVSFLFRVFALFIILAILDVMVQRWQYKKQLRMTKEEVKREYKQDEGDPIIKSVRKQLHQELAMGDVKQAVSSSDVLITNPTHLAIAIKYDEREMIAPQVMAKGQRAFAEKIIEFAKEANVPIVRNVPLAWSLIEVDIGQEIPEDLYQTMAEVLVIVYRMKEQKQPLTQ